MRDPIGRERCMYSGPPAIVELDRTVKIQRIGESVSAVVRTGHIGLIRGLTLMPDDVVRVGETIGDVFTPVKLPPGRELADATELRELGEIEHATNWHHDQSFVASPPDWSILYCHEPGTNRVPTVLADGASLIDFLTPALVEVLATLRVEHLAYYPTDDDEAGPVLARAVHPLLVPVEGASSAIFAAPATVRRFVGWTVRESAGLVSYLFNMLNWPEVNVSHYWRRGDLLMWPNRRFPHRTLPMNTGSTRHLTRVVGHWPTLNSAAG